MNTGNEFLNMKISDSLISGLSSMNIIKPTQIQIKSYEAIIDNKDIFGCSQTGSGKTLAYLLPVLSKIEDNNSNIQAVIVVPTQELCVQVNHVIDNLIKNSNLNIKSTLIAGDGNINRQIDALKNKPQIIVGTAGRIVKLNKMKKLSLHHVKTLIIDEADKMLAKDNFDSLLDLRRCLLKYTQVIMFSASVNNKTMEKANQISNMPIFIDCREKVLIPKTIKHMYIVTTKRERVDTLKKVLSALKGKEYKYDKCIIFANTAYDLEETYDKLSFHNYNVTNLYGSEDKISRKNSIEGFKSGKYNYMVCTDLASRGLQIDNINAVINVNLPADATEYQHRAGRCGRNDNTGICISLITENEINKINEYKKKFGINIVQKRLYKGQLVAK